MKNVLLLLGLFLAVSLYAQTNEYNQKKYWKFRNNFRRDFIKIGSEQGAGLPAASREPISCINNDPDVLGGNKGTLRWADAMIFQGHYIGFLATEYALLKQRDQDVEATLNELYYALNAINRSDRLAEPIITGIAENELPVEKGESLNGFYLRDDVGEDFHVHWEGEKMDCRCTQGNAYLTNNMARLNGGNNVSKVRTTDHSTPSLDQMTSLLVGISMINKLVEDGVYVQPTAEDSVMDIKNEALQIANRLITYARDHNWYILNEWGWPVGNGGGELIATSYPLTVIGENLLGGDFSSTMKRNYPKYDKAQIYHQMPTVEDRLLYLLTLSEMEQIEVNLYSEENPWPNDIPGLSNFEAYQSNIFSIEFSTDDFQYFWELLTTGLMESVYEDWEYDHTLNLTFAPHPIGLIVFDDFPLKDYNYTIVSNLGVASGIFSQDQISDLAEPLENYQMPLIDAVLKDYTPAYFDQATFKTLLDEMPIYGGFKFHGQSWLGYKVDGSDSVSANQIIYADGWGGEYKWNDKIESNGWQGHQGQFNALDYLYMHNLYYLVYGDEIETEFEETYDCLCGDVSMADITSLQAEADAEISGAPRNLTQVLDFDVALHSKIVKQMSVLDFCVDNTFNTSSTAGTISIKQLFDDYHDIGISLNEFQTEEFTVEDGGKIDIEARLVICNEKELIVEDGGTVNLDKGEILIKPGAKLIIEGNVNINQYTKVIVEEGGEIIIRNGGTLANSGYIRLKEGAKMTYEDGAIFTMKDDNAELHFDGGDLFLEANALFTFEKGTSQSGQLRFSEWGEHIFTEGNNRILLEGNGDNDPVLVLDEDADFWTNTEDGLDWIAILSGEVQLNENSRLVSLCEFTANNVHFSGLGANRGLVTFDQTNISNAVFDETPIYAALHYKNAGTFDMTLTEVNHTIDGNMIKIKGMGYNISESEFNGDATYMISAQNIAQYSRITNTDFNGTLSTVGIIDNSNGTVEIKSCNFNTLYAGVHKLDGKAILRCNDFADFKLAGAIAHNNCILDISSNAQGGYNVFQKNSIDFGKNIALWNAQGLLINEGYNFFDEQGLLPIIEGTMQVAPPDGVGAILLATSNRWNDANDAALPEDFNVTSSIVPDLVVNFATSTPNDGTCPISDILIGGTGFVVPSYQDGEATLNTLNFNQVSLSVALNTCIEATNTYDDSKTDVAALALFEEVLTNYPSYDTSRRNDVLVRYGASLMKQTLQHAFDNGEISISDNQAQFHAGVQSYVNVLNALTSVPYNAYNYEQLFYLEMDKAHLFRMLGKTDMALFILLNAETCGLDLEEQEHLNHYKFEWDEEIRMVDYGYKAEFKDTVWVDTTYYNVPTQQVFGEFGSVIVDASTVNYFTCGQARSQMNEDREHNVHPLMVYPNPNNGVFNVEYRLSENSTGFVIVHDELGHELYRFECRIGQQNKSVNISGLATGTYFYSFYVNEKLENTGKVIVK